MNYSDKNVKCPFYKNTDKKSIKCEGIFSNFCINSFSDKEKARVHFTKYCCDDYKKCPVAEIIIKKYVSEVT